ncbi:dihydrofolate reductase-like domain-containing protein [Filobasidium floriforme]|uniref:dihydrofolate reductase-like domain-containing protein n=1 Tax=Filobasidium floriforme TaxID=5210 RepID=UPI001E8DAAE0|nr:dihydrofolate reductase-like domain-containing protein [Filobasidium floriforme]KAH8085392.1 dihydrofolate reductase-like domain-containing protein [Filobasidium floriforme]
MSHSRGSSRLTIIVAATQSMGIGAGGGLPWKLPGEMKYFARATTGSSSSSSSSPHPPPSSTSSPQTAQWNSVIMGRKTWESIPPKFRPLKGRRNVIISRDPAGVDLSGCEQTTAVGSLEEAIRAVSSPTSTSSSSSFTSPSPPTTTTTTQIPPPNAPTPPPARPTHVNYLIGGAQLYTLALQHDLVDRILFTRVLSPGFEGVCDVFLPDFTGGFRRKIGERQDNDEDHDHENNKQNKVNKEDVEKANSKEQEEKASSVWKFKQRPHSALEEFVGFQVPEGEVEEKGVRYRFELWEREE